VRELENALERVHVLGVRGRSARRSSTSSARPWRAPRTTSPGPRFRPAS
jgi:hypothetical protein